MVEQRKVDVPIHLSFADAARLRLQLEQQHAIGPDGGEVGPTGPTTIAAEWAYGSTALGFPGGSFRMDFDTIYLLLSQKRGMSRWTARVERFTTNDHSRPPGDLSREHGSAFTLSYLHESSASLRSGLEYVHVKGDRLSAPDPRTGFRFP